MHVYPSMSSAGHTATNVMSQQGLNAEPVNGKSHCDELDAATIDNAGRQWRVAA